MILTLGKSVLHLLPEELVEDVFQGLTFVSHCFPLDPGHKDIEASDLFFVTIGFGCYGIYLLARSTLFCLSANFIPVG